MAHIDKLIAKELDKRKRELCKLFGFDYRTANWHKEILPKLKEVKRKADRYDAQEKGAR